MLRIYGDRFSGNCYKVELVSHILGLDFEWINIDILAGDTQSSEFLKMNPNAKIPLLVLPDGRCLSESNAIINFLADATLLSPSDKYEQALMQQWQFFEQYSHEPFIAVARFINKYLGLPESRQQEYLDLQVGGHKALAVMELHLHHNQYLVGNQLSCADISLYAYTHVAHEGGVELTDYPGICAWMRRIEGLASYRAMAT
ncbi:glutathione S-transferase family protein [Alginatibacterium sediminis]|uniref:Glutathione S-transferase family protein n=1 Tax=Alginatibacterium sediminis TaxID=2164068 RepID=A0A420EGB8_9ALTE|nr:glutathione S-transferase family protein [Alginatibacterium sediminis]RKF19713.1 glutathione S-transferase family protein [Alginatibacterium sediminis]